MIVPRITELKDKVASLQAEIARFNASQPTRTEAPKEYYATFGRALIDDETGLIITVKSTSPDASAQIAVQFPEKDTSEEEKINPGKKWRFRFNDKDYLLTVTEVSFLGSSIRFRITHQ